MGSIELVLWHNLVVLPIGGIFAPGRQTPTWEELNNKISWTGVGYHEYESRKDW